MGGGGGGKKGGAPSPPPPPPPPPQPRDPGAQGVAARARAATRNRRGRAATLLRGNEERLGSPASSGQETLGA